MCQGKKNSVSEEHPVQNVNVFPYSLSIDLFIVLTIERRNKFTRSTQCHIPTSLPPFPSLPSSFSDTPHPESWNSIDFVQFFFGKGSKMTTLSEIDRERKSRDEKVVNKCERTLHTIGTILNKSGRGRSQFILTR
jgi:hypothetical protein